MPRRATGAESGERHNLTQHNLGQQSAMQRRQGGQRECQAVVSQAPSCRRPTRHLPAPKHARACIRPLSGARHAALALVVELIERLPCYLQLVKVLGGLVCCHTPLRELALTLANSLDAEFVPGMFFH